MEKYKVGDVVIAKNSHKKCGYLRGDTLKIDRKSIFDGEFVAKNLSRPNLREDGEAYVGDYFRGKKMPANKNAEDVYEIYFLGLPLFRVKKAVDE
jgi:hypothetical protein